MRLLAPLLLCFCASAFAQDDPANAAAESAKRRVPTLRFFDGQKLYMGTPGSKLDLGPFTNNVPRRMVLLGTPQAVCAIPLLNALPPAPAPEAISRMPVIKPRRMDESSVVRPMPACPEGMFQNK